MTIYISLLRGINVSGQKVIKMDALKKIYEELNFKNVQTYIQSGNVIFQDSDSDSIALEQKISNKIKEHIGFNVPVIVLNIEKLKALIGNNPYIAEGSKIISDLYVTILSSRPENIDLQIIRQNQSPGEEFTLMDEAVYLYCPNGYGRTKLTNTFFEKKLRVSATTRNWKTTLELLNIAERSTYTKM